MTNATAYAVLRGMDDTARAIFHARADAVAYAEHLNQTVPFALAFGSGAHLCVALPWTIPADLFDTDGTKAHRQQQAAADRAGITK